jgi:hypothetical protein
VLACALALLAASGASAATTLTPNRFDDPGLDGEFCKPLVAGKCSLRGAVNDAEAGDTVLLGPGTYVLEIASLGIDANITIAGAGPTATTIQQTAVGSRVIDAEKSSGLTISGVTITGGNLIAPNSENAVGVGADGDDGPRAEGAGVLGSSTTKLIDVVIAGNTAFGGDGGDGATGSSSVPGGEGGRGGGVSGAGIDGFLSLVMLRVAIIGNVGFPGEAGAGGAAAVGGDAGKGGPGGATVGAGVGVGFSAMTATDSLIAGNIGHTSPGGHGGNSGPLGTPGVGGQGAAANGAGIFANASLKLTNVTIAGNTAEGGTGGAGGNSTNNGLPISGGAGGSGSGGGGGGVSLFNGAAGTFASVTIAGNQVGVGVGGPGGNGSSGGGKGATGFVFTPDGGNVFISDAALQMRGTLIANGVGDAGAEECTVQSNGTLTSLGNNLIGRSAQCIAAPQASDKLGAAANLEPLANNGGLTQTLALLPGSAAIDAGPATCLDADGLPLATDQRGAPRLSPCDIGAFERQPSEIPVPPGGSPPGGAGAGSSAGTPKLPGVATLSQLKLKPKKPRSGSKATISFALDLAAQVDFTLQRKVRGVKAGGKCVKRPAGAGAGAKGKGCVRLVKATGAPKPLAATAGANQLTWTPRGLQPGRYQLTATPAGGLPHIAGFKLQPKPPRR